MKVHLKNILQKLDVKDRTEAVTTALHRGFIGSGLSLTLVRRNGEAAVQRCESPTSGWCGSTRRSQREWE